MALSEQQMNVAKKRQKKEIYKKNVNLVEKIVMKIEKKKK